MKNKVVICEESDIIASGIKKIAEGIKLNVVAHIRNVAQLTDKIRQTDAQILIIDLSVLGQFRNDFMQSLNREFVELETVVFANSCIDRKTLSQYENAFTINDSQEEIEELLEKVAHNNKNKASSDTLSKREKDILIAVAKGMMNKEISEELKISIHTVITHRKNITKKTGIHSVSGFTVYALLNNLIDESDVQK